MSDEFTAADTASDPTARSTNRWPTGRPGRSGPPVVGSAMRLKLAESRTCRSISWPD